MSTYTTKQGDQWDEIAFHQLGSTAYTGNLMMVNAKYIWLHTFPAGIVLKLPEVSDVVIDDDLPPWKQEEEGDDE